MASSNDSSVAPSPAEDSPQAASASPEELAAVALDAAAGRKASDLTILDLREVNSVSDFFVIATGDSKLHIRAIVNAVENHLRETCEEGPWRSEGREHREWVVLDYVTLVVHVFSKEKRAYYDLERLWGDAPSETLDEDAETTEAELLEHVTQREQS